MEIKKEPFEYSDLDRITWRALGIQTTDPLLDLVMQIRLVK